MAGTAARDARQRKRDTVDRLEHDVDAWVATAGPGGSPYLVPLSFYWDGSHITFATVESSPTARNLRAGDRVRLGIGPTRDVVLVEGTVEVFSRERVPADLAESFAARLWDPRKDSVRYAYFRVTPQRIMAWREENELPGRELMRDGRWLI